MLGPLRTTAAVLAMGALPFGILAGCESVERQTGFSKRTQISAGAGAAVGGTIAAIANANPAWIAASTILGGLAGGAISEYLQRDDVEKHAHNQYQSLQTLEEGQTSTWSNAETGHRGSTTVTDVFTMADGTQCKNFIEVIETGERTIRQSATACKVPGGDWKVRTA